MFDDCVAHVAGNYNLEQKASDAGGKCACPADPQLSNKCVRGLRFAQASCCLTVEHSIHGGGVNRAINILLRLSNVNGLCGT